MELHAKAKGTLGELAIAQDLLEQGYPVFSELGDLSRVDLITLAPMPVRIQVKAYVSKDDTVNLSRKKSGPNYRFLYTPQDVDIFAVYVLDHNLIAYLTAQQVCSTATGITLRVRPSRFPQKTQHDITKYRKFERALRDYTGYTLSGTTEGDEIVQTTTLHMRPGKPGVVGNPMIAGSNPAGGTKSSNGFKEKPSAKTNKCLVCQISIYSKSTHCILHVPKQSKIIWPSDEIMSQMVWEKPLTHIGTELGVTDNTVRKHCITRNIKLPGKGHWQKVYQANKKLAHIAQ